MSRSKDKTRTWVLSRDGLFNQPGGRKIEIIGAPKAGVEDLYHSMLRARWWEVLLAIAALFIGVNVLFAVGFLATGGVANARSHSFSDVFFFSVQTFGTIGYGAMYPHNFGAHLLVTLEILIGMVAMAMMTGLIFAKFSRPTARVMFSKVAVISARDGVPTLMFRVANERANHVVEAQLRVALLVRERTREGEQVRRIYDLQLVRSQSPAFVLTWTALHPITPESPLYGIDHASLKSREGEIIVTFTGIDEVLSQTIHARHSYLIDEIIWKGRLVDMLVVGDGGKRIVDYRRFHEHQMLD